MSDYYLGLFTAPIVLVASVAIYALWVWLFRALRHWWIAPTEFSPKDWGKRARHASCVFAARRVWAFKLPGSRLLVFRSTVGGADYKYGAYFTDTDEIRRRVANVLLDEFDPR